LGVDGRLRRVSIQADFGLIREPREHSQQNDRPVHKSLTESKEEAARPLRTRQNQGKVAAHETKRIRNLAG
jgi:hypothetical protein